MTNFFRRLLRPLPLAIGWTLLLFAGLSIPADTLTSAAPLFSADKLVHVGLFAIFGFLWLRVRAARSMERLRQTYAVVCTGGLAFATATELYQHVLPLGRQGDPYDVLANAVGLLLAVVVYHRYSRWRQHHGSRFHPDVETPPKNEEIRETSA